LELENLKKQEREILAKKFIEEVILPQWTQLSSWNSLTNQTSQLDFGYLSQHLVSLITGIKGNNQRGKGDDLADGSEVKSASCIDAEDTPRWNNVNCGAKETKELVTKLESLPYLFFVLLDTTEKGGNTLRCRIWCVRPKQDKEFMKVAKCWSSENDSKKKNEKLKTNFQLHPPRWEKAQDNLTTNNCGNLKLPLIYESIQMNIPGILVMKTMFFDPKIIKNGLSESVDRL